jgi:tRNA dimethylallyltransferase
MCSKTVIIISGPTASGKTELAFELAKHLNTSIISADSRQCFRELNIGVAKPCSSQLEEVKHFFISSHSIHEEVNASIFEALAIQWCEELFAVHDAVIICGGTGLYIKAFREGLDEIPVIDEGIRKRIFESYENLGLAWLQDTIRTADPDFYDSVEKFNPQRMMRALEVIQSTGRSILSFRNRQKKIRPFRILEFGLSVPRKELYQRINERVDKMMNSGLLDEVISLLPYQNMNALQTVGYSELFEYLKGKCVLEESISMIKQNTRNYAKRQMTWFRKNENLVWLETDFINRILAEYQSVKV